jgi:sucrose phosphorylase
MLSLAGVPGIYIHSLFGSRSYYEGVKRTGRYRSINREKLLRSKLERELDDPTSLRHRVFHPYLRLIKARATQRAFHPNGPQQVLSTPSTIFGLLRTAPDESERVLCLLNVSAETQSLQVDLGSLHFPRTDQVRDLIAGSIFSVSTDNTLSLQMSPYQVLWLV